MTNLENALKLAQQYFNKKEYVQFILPIKDAIEGEHRKLFNQKVSSSLKNAIESSITTLTEKAEEIAEVPYVKLEDVVETLKKELSIYSI